MANIIVLGSGMAGFGASHRLAANGITPVLYEKSHYFGGHTASFRDDKGFLFDLGPHISFTKDELAEGKVFYNFTQIDAANAAEELPGLSAFYRDEAGEVFHTYSSFARGPEELIGTFMILDHIARARAAGLPHVYLGYWVNGSRKMAYKVRFQPQEHLGPKGWERFDHEAV